MSKKEETIIDELANLKKDGDPAFDEPEKDTPTATPAKETEKEKDADAPEAAKKIQEEENVPFHQHPRWKQREKDWEERFNALEQTYSTKQREVEEKLKTYEAPKTAQIPSWFTTIFGDNADAWEKYSEHSKAERTAIKTEVMQEITATEQKKVVETKRWEEWVKKSMADLKDEGLEFDDNEVMKIAVEYQPIDEKGNVSLRKAYDIYSKIKSTEKPNIEAKKELAASTTIRSSDGSKKTFLTAKDVRNKDWRSLINN